MKKYALELKWGFIFVAVQLAWFILEKFLGYYDENISKHENFSMLFMIPAIIVMFLGLREIYIKKYNYQMGWGRGILSGFIISLVVAIMSIPLMFLFSYVLAPDFFENAINYAVESGKANQQEAAEYFNFENYLMSSAIFSLIAGVLTTLVILIVLKFFVKKS